MRTNEIRIDLLRKQNESLKNSIEKLLSMNTTLPTMVTEERYEELRTQSRQEQVPRKSSFVNESIASVGSCNRLFVH